MGKEKVFWRKFLNGGIVWINKFESIQPQEHCTVVAVKHGGGSIMCFGLFFCCQEKWYSTLQNVDEIMKERTNSEFFNMTINHQLDG